MERLALAETRDKCLFAQITLGALAFFSLPVDQPRYNVVVHSLGATRYSLACLGIQAVDETPDKIEMTEQPRQQRTDQMA